jgi:hypothetical protein
LQNLEDAITALNSVGSVPVTSVTAGTCISISGTANAPVVSITPTGIAAGTYNGFKINSCGLVTSYTPVPPVAINIVGTFPIASFYNNLAAQWEISIAKATFASFGSVQLADEAEATVATPNVPGESAITFDFLVPYLQTNYTTTIAGTDAVNAVYTNANKTWTVSVDDASTGTAGLVKLADVGEAGVLAPALPNPGDGTVVTWGFLKAFLQARGVI